MCPTLSQGLERIRQSKTSLWKTRSWGVSRGKQPELRLPSGPGIEVPIENSERFWTLPSRGYEVGKGFKQKSHPTCDYLLLAFQIVRSQPEEILLICETLRLSGSHTLVATALTHSSLQLIFRYKNLASVASPTEGYGLLPLFAQRTKLTPK